MNKFIVDACGVSNGKKIRVILNSSIINHFSVINKLIRDEDLNPNSLIINLKISNREKRIPII